MKRPSIDEYYLNIAKAVSERSTCLKKHYGCVIVKNGEIISTGYNNPPRGEPHC
jgi:dCMP deaminase